MARRRRNPHPGILPADDYTDDQFIADAVNIFEQGGVALGELGAYIKGRHPAGSQDKLKAEWRKLGDMVMNIIVKSQ